MADTLPPWLARWFCSLDTGISSLTVAAALCDVPAIWQIQREPDAPRDTSDVGRCVRLLDLAAKNGEDWRARLPEVAGWCPKWAPLVPRWAEVEAAYHEDVAAQMAHRRALYLSPTGRRLTRPRKDIPLPPSRCWWLVATLCSGYDPYARMEPHPFREGGSRG